MIYFWLGLRCCAGFCLVVASKGYSSCGVQVSHCSGFSFCAAWTLVCTDFSSCGSCEVASVVSNSVRPHRRQPTRHPVPGILQARTLEWVAISFSNAWKWKVKVKSLSRVRLFATPWTAAHQAPPPKGFSRREYWSGCHRLLRQLPNS